MSLRRHFRDTEGRALWMRAALASVTLVTLLAARNVPPDFPQTPSVGSRVSATLHHDQRPRFDNSGLKWSTPTGDFLPDPLVVESAHLAPAPQFFSTLQSKGFHFNRPPPIS